MAKHHKHKASGGEADFGKPREDWKEEESSKPKAYAGAGSDVQKESEEKKHGGKAKRRRHRTGGAVAAKAHGGAAHISKHHEHGEDMKHAKHVGHVKGEQYHAPKSHTRRERKAGGRTGSNFNPLSSAHGGTPPRDHKVHEID